MKFPAGEEGGAEHVEAVVRAAGVRYQGPLASVRRSAGVPLLRPLARPKDHLFPPAAMGVSAEAFQFHPPLLPRERHHGEPLPPPRLEGP